MSFVDACFTYLAEDGRASESSALQERVLTALTPLRQAQQEGQPGLRAFDPRAMDLGTMLVVRSNAGARSGRFADAVASYEKCLEFPAVREAPVIPAGMAICLLRLGRVDEAIEWYRRAMKPNGWEPGLVFDLLSVVATRHGPAGVSKELAALAGPKIGVSARRNTTLSCFRAWCAMSTDDVQGARDAAFDAREYVLLARCRNLSAAEGPPSDNELAVSCVILERVFRWLKNDEQARAFSKQLEAMPSNAVENARRILDAQNAQPKRDGGGQMPPKR